MSDENCIRQIQCKAINNYTILHIVSQAITANMSQYLKTRSVNDSAVTSSYCSSSMAIS